jgi:uncharacterized membrane protein YcaP (DUF421 family)
MLIFKGKVNRVNLDKVKITMEELIEAIREHGVTTIEEVDLAVFEVDGNISVLSDQYKRKTSRRRKARKLISKNQ